MKTFKQYLAEMITDEQYDIFQGLSNTLANCRNNPFKWLGDLTGIYKIAEKQGVQEITRMVYELTQLAVQFQNDVRNYVRHSAGGQVAGIDPQYDEVYQPRYERFMREAHRLIDRVRHLRGQHVSDRSRV